MSLALALAFVCFTPTQSPKTDPLNVDEARAFFQTAKRLWTADGGKLWGTSLEGPLLFVEPRSRKVAASQADAEGLLKAEGDVFVGTLPSNVPVANTAYKWAGVTWIMIMWPFPKDVRDQLVLLMHEPFHRAQTQIGFPMTGPRNSHLDQADGRYWLRLEWKALSKAMETEGEPRLQAIKDALLFRAVRRARFPEARIEEGQLEMHEGLANYTGVALSGMNSKEQHAYLIDLLAKAKNRPSFTRSFAYISGPAYGILLDDVDPQWRKYLKASDDLGELIRARYKLADPGDSKKLAEERAGLYEGKELWTEEEARRVAYEAKVNRYRELLVDKPVLVIPLVKMQTSFNPNNVMPVEKLGTIYEAIKIIDVWGTITVSKGALISNDYKKLTVSAPSKREGQPLQGEGWTMELKPGWELKPGEREGDWLLVQTK